VALWLCDSLALWLCVSVSLWLYSSVALWLYSSVALWLCGSLTLWLCGSGPLCGPIALWLCVSLALWLCGSIALCLCGSLTLWPCGSVKAGTVVVVRVHADGPNELNEPYYLGAVDRDHDDDLLCWRNKKTQAVGQGNAVNKNVWLARFRWLHYRPAAVASSPSAADKAQWGDVAESGHPGPRVGQIAFDWETGFTWRGRWYEQHFKTFGERMLGALWP